MCAARSTHLTQRQSQRTRKRAIACVEDDFYDCPRCRKLFTRYHGSHKRHIKSCKVKYEALAQEEARLRAGWIKTPTPGPYTPVPADVGMEAEDMVEPGA